MYYDAYDESGFYHVTCSFDGDIPFGATNCMTARDYWESIGNSIKKLLAENLIDGAYFVHEMSIRSFLPLRVVPHTHAIVSCGSFPREVIKYLGELIADCPEIELTPSINVRLIDSRADMSSMLKYVTKATDLSTAYNSAITQLNECGEKPRDLNCEMKDFLDSFGAASGHFKKIVRIGNMMSQRNSFIGARGDERDRVFGRYLTDFKNAKKDAKSKTTIQTQP